MTETQAEKRYADTQVTWCLTRGRYADPSVGCDTATDHDHYDIVLDQHGKTLFRVWPVGTTFRTADGYTMRLANYHQGVSDMLGLDRDDIPARPQWDGVSPNGGAFSDSKWLPGEGDVIIVYALPEGGRPAPGALFARPNGEAWRLRSYSVDWDDEVDFSNKRPSWSVNLPSGAGTNGDDLPDDARLVWHP